MESWDLLLRDKVDLVIDDPTAFALSDTEILSRSSGAKSIFPITELSQKIYLAASKSTHPQIVKKLREAHKVIARTVYFQQVMASRYNDLPLTQ